MVTAADLAEELVQSFSAGTQGESAGGGGWLLRQQVTGCPRESQCWRGLWRSGEGVWRGGEGPDRSSSKRSADATSHLQFLTLLISSAA